MDDITTNSFLQQTGTKLCKNKYLKRQMHQSVLSFVRFYFPNKTVAATFAVKQHFLQRDKGNGVNVCAAELEKIISSGGRWVDDLCMRAVSDELLCNCNYDPHRRGGSEGMHQPLSKLSPAPANSLHIKQKVWRISSFVSVTHKCLNVSRWLCISCSVSPCEASCSQSSWMNPNIWSLATLAATDAF